MKRVIQWFSGLSRKGKGATIAALLFVLVGIVGNLTDGKSTNKSPESGLIEVKDDNTELKEQIKKVDDLKAAQEKVEQQKQVQETQPETPAPAASTAPTQTKAQQPPAASNPAPAPTEAQAPAQTAQPAEPTTPPPSQPAEPDPVVVTPPPPAPPAPASNDSAIVHTTESGSKYHSAGCQYLSKSDITVTLAQAKASGLTACSKCGPPQ